MLFSKMSSSEYKKLYSEARLLIQRALNLGTALYIDPHDAAQDAIELYTKNKDTLSLEQCVSRVFSNNGKGLREEVSYSEKHDPPNPCPEISRTEAQLDLYRIYLLAKDSLTWQERSLFVQLVEGTVGKTITHIKKTLVEKLKYAVTAPKENYERDEDDGEEDDEDDDLGGGYEYGRSPRLH